MAQSSCAAFLGSAFSSTFLGAFQFFLAIADDSRKASVLEKRSDQDAAAEVAQLWRNEHNGNPMLPQCNWIHG